MMLIGPLQKCCSGDRGKILMKNESVPARRYRAGKALFRHAGTLGILLVGLKGMLLVGPKGLLLEGGYWWDQTPCA